MTKDSRNNNNHPENQEVFDLEARIKELGLSWNRLAGAISHLSGTAVSHMRFARANHKFSEISFTPAEWIATAEALRLSDEELIKYFRQEYERSKSS